MFRRAAVLHADHRRAGAAGKSPGDGVLGVQIAQHPAAAVVVNHAGLRQLAAGKVPAQGNVPSRQGQRIVLDGEPRGTRMVVGKAELPPGAAAFLERISGRNRVQPGEKFFELGMHHGGLNDGEDYSSVGDIGR